MTTDQRARLRLPGDLGPLAVGVTLAVLVTGAWRQVAHPFLEHDDWEFLLPVNPERIDQHHSRLLAEGRWFNYAWWRTVGHLLTPTVAALFFSAVLLLLAVLIARRWAPGWLFVPTVVALFSWPMITDLSYWPATMAPSVLLLAAAVATLPFCTEDRRRLIGWVFASTVLVFLAYPALTVIVLVVLVGELIDRPLRELALLVVAFGIAYAVATGIVFSLNGWQLGTFGVEVRPWRNPNHLHDFGDLAENISRVGDQVRTLLGTATIPFAIGALAVLACLLRPEVRDRGIRLVLLGVVGFGVQSSATVLTGVSTPFRSMGWAWLLPVIALVWLAQELGLPRWQRATAVVGLVLVASWGVRYDLGVLDDYQDRRARYEKILDRVDVLVEAHPGARILIVGTTEDWANPVFTREAQYLSQKALDDDGTVMVNCHPPGCAPAANARVMRLADRGVRAVMSGPYIVVVPTAHRR